VASHSAAAKRVTPEWRLLELTTLGLTAEDQTKEFERLVRGDKLNWGDILDQAIRHKVISLLAHQIGETGLWDAVPSKLGEHLRETLRVCRYRVKVYREAAVVIAATLREHGVRVACTKGIVLEQTVYDGKGQRFFGDIDFMICPEDGEKVTDALHRLGYVNGYLDQTSGKIQSFTRRDLIAYRLNPDHLPAFVKTLDDVVMPHVHVDFACSLTWTQCKYQAPVSEALADVPLIEVPGTNGRTIPSLNLHYLFIFTVLHLFREAWVLNWIDLGQDVNLIKFGDVIRLWTRFREQLATNEFRRLLQRVQLEEPIAWVLVHADRTFGVGMAKALDLDKKVTEDFLASGSPRGGQQIRWHGTMLDRLQARDRRNLLTRTAESIATP